jgi:hypothetical protein
MMNEDPSYFRKVSECLHLNPADAGLDDPGKLAEYRWSRYPFYLQLLSNQPEWQTVLNQCLAHFELERSALFCFP